MLWVESLIHSIAQPSPSGRSCSVEPGKELDDVGRGLPVGEVVDLRPIAGGSAATSFSSGTEMSISLRGIGGSFSVAVALIYPTTPAFVCSTLQRVPSERRRIAPSASSCAVRHVAILRRSTGEAIRGHSMPAYWVARSKINDPVEYKKYTDLVPGDHRQVRRQGAGARRPLSDHGRAGQIPPLRGDRVSDLRAGRRLLHLAGIRPGRGLPPQRRRRGRDHHGRRRRCDAKQVWRGQRPTSRDEPQIADKMAASQSKTGGTAMLRK